MVIGLNLCPFAKKEWVQNRVKLVVSEVKSTKDLLQALLNECDWLSDHPETETTLLIHPWVLEDFLDYNQFLDDVDNMLEDNELEGIFQVASFHPHYQFAGTESHDVENATNRSPFPDPELIPERNIALLRSIGKERVEALLQSFGGFHAR